jgi:hypothetical protein
MTDGETLILIGVIAFFVVFSAVLAYSQITSGGRRLREGSASRICPACPHKSACDAWLANDNPGFEPPASCPNKGYLGVVASASRGTPLNRARYG